MGNIHTVKLLIEGLSLSRGERPLISELNLSVEPGQALWLTGPNGIGKTTILLACAGLLRPDRGHVLWQTADAEILPPETVLAYAADRGPETNGLTLGEELSFWQALYQDNQSLELRLASVGLSGRDQTPIDGLSSGQRRRLSLARLLCSNRPAWLMDEPLAGLDEHGRMLITETLSTHLAQGGVAMIASHQPVPIQGVTAQKLVLQPGVEEADA